jgi:hypothetical protein
LCFIQKIRRRLLDDVTFAEFDRNSNFVLAGSDPVKKNSIFVFIFNCVLFKKIRRRSLDDVVLAEFDRNPNFVLDDILLDVVARLRNHEKCSSCWIDFVRDEIAHSLMEQ